MVFVALQGSLAITLLAIVLNFIKLLETQGNVDFPNRVQEGKCRGVRFS